MYIRNLQIQPPASLRITISGVKNLILPKETPGKLRFLGASFGETSIGCLAATMHVTSGLHWLVHPWGSDRSHETISLWKTGMVKGFSFGLFASLLRRDVHLDGAGKHFSHRSKGTEELGMHKHIKHDWQRKLPKDPQCPLQLGRVCFPELNSMRSLLVQQIPSVAQLASISFPYSKSERCQPNKGWSRNKSSTLTSWAHWERCWAEGIMSFPKANSQPTASSPAHELCFISYRGLWVLKPPGYKVNHVRKSRKRLDNYLLTGVCFSSVMFKILMRTSWPALVLYK